MLMPLTPPRTARQGTTHQVAIVCRISTKHQDERRLRHEPHLAPRDSISLGSVSLFLNGSGMAKTRKRRDPEQERFWQAVMRPASRKHPTNLMG
jgi:hypothetical protein